jgi:hypothetical protein
MAKKGRRFLTAFGMTEKGEQQRKEIPRYARDEKGVTHYTFHLLEGDPSLTLGMTGKGRNDGEREQKGGDFSLTLEMTKRDDTLHFSLIGRRSLASLGMTRKRGGMTRKRGGMTRKRGSG